MDVFPKTEVTMGTDGHEEVIKDDVEVTVDQEPRTKDTTEHSATEVTAEEVTDIVEMETVPGQDQSIVNESGNEPNNCPAPSVNEIQATTTPIFEEHPSKEKDEDDLVTGKVIGEESSSTVDLEDFELSQEIPVFGKSLKVKHGQAEIEVQMPPEETESENHTMEKEESDLKLYRLSKETTESASIELQKKTGLEHCEQQGIEAEQSTFTTAGSAPKSLSENQDDASSQLSCNFDDDDEYSIPFIDQRIFEETAESEGKSDKKKAPDVTDCSETLEDHATLRVEAMDEVNKEADAEVQYDTEKTKDIHLMDTQAQEHPEEMDVHVMYNKEQEEQEANFHLMTTQEQTLEQDSKTQRMEKEETIEDSNASLQSPQTEDDQKDSAENLKMPTQVQKTEDTDQECSVDDVFPVESQDVAVIEDEDIHLMPTQAQNVVSPVEIEAQGPDSEPEVLYHEEDHDSAQEKNENPEQETDIHILPTQAQDIDWQDIKTDNTDVHLPKPQDDISFKELPTDSSYSVEAEHSYSGDRGGYVTFMHARDVDSAEKSSELETLKEDNIETLKKKTPVADSEALEEQNRETLDNEAPERDNHLSLDADQDFAPGVAEKPKDLEIHVKEASDQNTSDEVKTFKEERVVTDCKVAPERDDMPEKPEEPDAQNQGTFSIDTPEELEAFNQATVDKDLVKQDASDDDQSDLEPGCLHDGPEDFMDSMNENEDDNDYYNDYNYGLSDPDDDLSHLDPTPGYDTSYYTTNDFMEMTSDEKQGGNSLHGQSAESYSTENPRLVFPSSTPEQQLSKCETRGPEQFRKPTAFKQPEATETRLMQSVAIKGEPSARQFKTLSSSKSADGIEESTKPAKRTGEEKRKGVKRTADEMESSWTMRKTGTSTSSKPDFCSGALKYNYLTIHSNDELFSLFRCKLPLDL